MANVNIKFNGKEYLLSCDNGQEEHLKELSVYLNKKFEVLKNTLGNIGENKLLLITSITIMDEYLETKKNIEFKKEEMNNLKKKFKELKRLVYEYKDDQENKIKNLIEIQQNLRNNINENKLSYEKVLDNTTAKIEDFIKKVSKENPI